MRRVSISDPTFTYDDRDIDGFRSGMFRLGTELGSEETGASVYELPPGQAICPYHYEYGEEEWVLVLSGPVTLRTPEGEAPLEAFDMAFFPKGPDGDLVAVRVGRRRRVDDGRPHQHPHGLVAVVAQLVGAVRALREEGQVERL